MTRKRILNITTTKKMDNMLNTAVNPDGTGAVVSSFDILASTGATFLWCATARDRESPNDDNASSVRERDSVYMRGLRESIFLKSNTQDCWRWRRICFTTKSIDFRGTLNTGTDPTSLETSNGWVRLLRNGSNTTFNQSMVVQLFKGAASIDWFNQFTAKVDTSRVDLKYDRTRILRSGNAAGVYLKDRHWYGMNKTLVYNNDEVGEGESISNYSSGAKPGMGDYYIYDLFDCATSNAASTLLNFQPEATLYWHER